MKILYLTLKAKYYWQILNKEKTIEYRQKKQFWDKKFFDFNYTHVLFQLGYSKKNRFVVPIKDFIISDFYEIHLDVSQIKIINKTQNYQQFEFPIYS